MIACAVRSATCACRSVCLLTLRQQSTLTQWTVCQRWQSCSPSWTSRLWLHSQRWWVCSSLADCGHWQLCLIAARCPRLHLRFSLSLHCSCCHDGQPLDSSCCIAAPLLCLLYVTLVIRGKPGAGERVGEDQLEICSKPLLWQLPGAVAEGKQGHAGSKGQNGQKFETNHSILTQNQICVCMSA